MARNHGIKYAQGDILAFTDADCICDRDWLSVIQKTIREKKQCFI
ncbi:glycosyltransferase [Patescibacteria group bacterium]|nr:glycosyltransferase [Patescibacteria group bacterium]